MLEGKELEGKLGEVGSYSVDVDSKLNVVLALEVAHEVEGVVKVSSKNSAEVHLFAILEKACAKNSVHWDEALLGQFKVLLGVIG